MSESTHSDFESLNALVDGELDRREREALLERVRVDEELRASLCDIQRVKEFVQTAYPEAEASAEPSGVQRGSGWRQIAAGVLLFGLGAIIGGGLQSQLGPSSLSAEQPFALSDVAMQPSKIVLYVGESDADKFAQALNRAEHYLKTNANTGTEINIVTSAGGVDMLRVNTTPYARKIAELADQYGALQFVACNATLSKLQKKGEPIGLVREARVAPSAVQFVVSRLKEGWAYQAI